jgi:putative ABC transport system substrate-binding protein
MAKSIRRRDVITLAAGAAALPFTARAHQSAIPVIGFLAVGLNGPNRWGAPLHQGLKEAGYVDGQNVTIDYRGGPPRLGPLQELAIDLVRRQVSVILTSNDGPALAARRATSTIPIVFFNIGSDPVTLKLVASINRPGGNVTGAGFDSPQLEAKRLDLLCQLVPTATTVAYLTNGSSLISFVENKNALVEAAAVLGRQLIIVECRSNDELGHSFVTMVERGAGAVTVGTLFGVNTDAVVSFAAQYKIPAIYNSRGFVLRRGLMSYSSDDTDNLRLAAGLVGQILNGAMPADLPVRRSTKFDFVINLKTAEELGLKFPPGMRAVATEVIE